ncbi:dihydrolipoamide acetyltransferase family protein [Georgenia sp. Z1491]|uniref:dihydrolipoamide acetyltransferase family protein n=1 Tax=Georgenia sp. Z1491 TaxID=3416707 RepID=UPI003CF06AAA
MATVIRMPGVLASMTEGIVAGWQVAEGDEVVQGTVLAEIETEKALVDFESEDAGVIGRLLAAEGDTVQVGEPIAILLAEAGEAYELSELVDVPPGDGEAQGGDRARGDGEQPDGERLDDETPTPARRASGADGADAARDLREAPAGAPPEPSAPLAERDARPGGRIFISPIARKMARERGIDPARLTGSGPGGRITRRDVEAQAAQLAAASPAPREETTPAAAGAGAGAAVAGVTSDAVEDVPVSGMRRAIARRLTESKSTVPHFYVTEECRVDALLALRRQVNESQGVKVSVNDFVLKAVAAAMAAVPDVNVTWGGDVIHRYRGVDVAVAVATDGGLVTPVVRGVEQMPISALATSVSELAGRARAGRLKQDEIEGGSFTVSNLGMFGTREFSAILNPPHAGILAVGAALEQPVVEDGQVVVGTVMRCTLSADHRAVDGALGARWMQEFRRAIESPLALLV